MDRRMSRRALLVAPLVLTASSCLFDDEEPTPTTESATPTTANSAQRTVVLPTSEQRATPTSTPRASVVPAATATPSPTPRSSPAATATATPSAPEILSPMTGLPISDRPEKPFAVQIDNAPQARPQTGLYRADVVYESPTEAGVTRFTAFFGTDLPYEIGPVRSVRQIALEVIPAHDGILVYSGASIDMTQVL
ncbi:MAG: DUF3048 domain-containing protein, partial [Chloroflexota bacterium]